jgi:hypothetical protein
MRSPALLEKLEHVGGVVLIDVPNCGKLILELHDLTDIRAFAIFFLVEMVMVVSCLLMGDEAFFLVGDDCFLGDPVVLVVAMFATPMMMVHHRSDLFR